MSERIEVSSDLTISTGQPTRDELRSLAEQGFRSVVDLRQESERNQPLSPVEERKAAEEAGLIYLHLPVPTDKLDHDLLARFHRELSHLPKPALIHCASGKRSGSLAFMADAINRGVSSQDMMGRAEQAGVLYGPSEIREQIRSFLTNDRLTVGGKRILKACARLIAVEIHAGPNGCVSGGSAGLHTNPMPGLVGDCRRTAGLRWLFAMETARAIPASATEAARGPFPHPKRLLLCSHPRQDPWVRM